MSAAGRRVAAMVSEVLFQPVRAGYDMGDVDAFLDEVVAVARSGQPIGWLVSEASFRTTTLREGYRMDQVDDFLDALVGAWDEADRAESPVAAPDWMSLPEQSGRPVTPLPPQGELAWEQRSRLSRLFRRRR